MRAPDQGPSLERPDAVLDEPAASILQDHQGPRFECPDVGFDKPGSRCCGISMKAPHEGHRLEWPNVVFDS